jgi:NACHT domain
MNRMPLTLFAAASRRQLRQALRLLQAAVALVAVFLLLSLVFSPPAERFCDKHSVGCGLVSGFASTTLILLGGYFFLFSWTLTRVINSYVTLAKDNPERFFPTPPRLRAKPARRPSLTQAVSRELAFSRRGAPLVVVGKAGAGKTTFLLTLTQSLAESGAVPVLVPLRTASLPLDLRALAEKEFLRDIDTIVRSEGDAQRVWRRFCREGAIVVLADGLDELEPGASRYQRDYLIRAAFTTARNDQLPVLVTSRPEAVPAGAGVSHFELEELSEAEALRYLEDAVHLRRPEDAERLLKTVRAGRVTQTPFYLNVIASLYRAERLPTETGTVDELLVGLLDQWTRLMQEERFLPEVELEAGERAKILEDLPAIAYAMTYRGALDCSIAELKEVFSDPRAAISVVPSDLEMVVEGAARLELIRTYSVGDDTALRFNHPINQAYLTSRFLRNVPDASRSLIEQTTSVEMREALLMWCASLGDAKTAEGVATALLERAAALGDDRALALVVTAAEIASAVGLPHFGDLAADSEREAWGKASSRGKLAAIRRLAGRAEPWVFSWLQEATGDRKNYRVRWSAARAIVLGGSNAYAALGDNFARLMDYAETVEPTEWGESEKHDLSVLGWILPALAVAVADGRFTELLRRDVARLTDLVRAPIALGTEASIAQGFKLAAVVNPKADLLPALCELLDLCKFWYSRIVVLQAVAVIAVEQGREDVLARVRNTRRDESAHPFVREAAGLCERAIRSRDWSRYVWEDENAVLARSGTTLAPETLALVADVVLFLNVTEQGEVQERERRKEVTYAKNSLPYCLAVSKDRGDLFTGCHQSCPFNLCPYPSSSELALARDEFSQAFCRNQIETLTRFSRVRSVFSRRANWWSNASRKRLAHFWSEMERRAG